MSSDHNNSAETVPLSAETTSETSPDRMSFKSSKSSTSSSIIADFSLLNAKIKKDKVKPSFNYDLEVFKLCKRYLKEKNHHGLALIARQKGLPPFLRFKVWPILLKYHPYVVKPSIQPDNHEKKPIDEEKLRHSIKKDLNKYLTRLKYSKKTDPSDEITNDNNESQIEQQIFEILENCIFKFMLKWGKIIKYDSALTWITLGLAEWLPAISKTPWVLVGRDLSDNNSSIKDLFIDYSNYIDNVAGLKEQLNELMQDDAISGMSFYDVYERLVLVLLHCPSNKLEASKSSTLNNEKLFNLSSNGGTIEERVTFFIYVFRKLLPELANFFSEEQILNKFGSNDDEWLIWWLKYCGSKVWSRLDRGKIWDILLGYKFQTPGKNYNEQLQLSPAMLTKLGMNDNFWSLNFDGSSCVDLTKLSIKDESSVNEVEIPFPQMNPHVQLVFITVALLKSKENTLIDLDQHEIRQYLSRLPTNSYNLTNKYQIFKQKIDKKREEESSKSSLRSSRSSTIDLFQKGDKQAISPVSNFSVSPDSQHNIISNDSVENHSIDFMDNILSEAGELWRKWLWVEYEQ